MNTLALDTASPRVAVAIVRADGERIEDARVGKTPRHVEELIPVVDALMGAMSLRGAAIDRIVVGIGPGQFNGLRVGVATAEVLAKVWKCELVGVSSLAALAWPYRERAPEVFALLDARRNAAYMASYRTEHWQSASEPTMIEVSSIGAALQESFVVGTPAVASAVEVPMAVDWPSPLAMIELAGIRSQRFDPRAVYLRPASEHV